MPSNRLELGWLSLLKPPSSRRLPHSRGSIYGKRSRFKPETSCFPAGIADHSQPRQKTMVHGVEGLFAPSSGPQLSDDCVHDPTLWFPSIAACARSASDDSRPPAEGILSSPDSQTLASRGFRPERSMSLARAAQRISAECAGWDSRRQLHPESALKQKGSVVPMNLARQLQRSRARPQEGIYENLS